MSIAIPKGTYDIVPIENDPELVWRESHLWQYLETRIRELAKCYNYLEIRTPIFERTELFQRGVGESSDIVSKEMYSFLDKGERSMTLRPEMTAAVMRSFAEKQMHLQLPLNKLFYIGPMFRYDRPQAGRYRQFHQFGAEVVGNASPYVDVEAIDFLYTLYQRLGIQGLTLHINSVGDATCRSDFKAALRDHLIPQRDKLSADSKVRLDLNPLRILDSKDAADHECLIGAPSLSDYLNDECRSNFENVLSLLEKLGIAYNVNPKLVRGLDYYNKTVYEITAGELGAQNTIGAGGRYDGLLKTLGGADLPAVGFATGIERVLQTMQGQKIAFPDRPAPQILFIGLDEAAQGYCFKKVQELRKGGILAEMDYSAKKLKDKLRYADLIRAKYVLVIGESEMEKGEADLKEMQTRTTRVINLKGLTCSTLEDLIHAKS